MRTQSTPYLKPIEKPKGLMLRMGYWWSKKEFGTVFSPLAVFCARMPSAFTRFYTTIGKLDKKLEIDDALRGLVREQVASLNACAFCMDSNRFAAMRDSRENAARFDELGDYRGSAQFSAAEKAALDYVTELTREHAVAPATFEALTRHFSEREICDLVYVVGTEHVFNLTNIGLGIGSDGLCDSPAAAKVAG
jgi:alkylhydroperoxidase family enzyme